MTSPAPVGGGGSFAHSHPQSLRSYLALLEERAELARVSRPVDLDYELSGYLSLTDHGPATLFEDVRCARFARRGETSVASFLPVVGNVANSRERLALAAGTSVDGLHDALTFAIRNPLPLAEVAEAPCQEVEEEEPSLSALPIPWFFEGETGPYITAGVIVCRDPLTGRGNLSIARLKPLAEEGFAPNEALIGIAPSHHLSKMARVAAARGEALEIAVTIGNHPAVVLAASLYLHYGDDELLHAGRLLGSSIEAVRGRSVDLLVPAHCELVLEGRLDTARTVREGPVSEFHGMYEDYGSGYVVSFQRLTRRKDALFQVIEPGYHSEHLYLGGVAIAAGLTVALGHYVPAVRQVAVPVGGSGRVTAVVQLSADKRPGDARRCMLAAWGIVNIVKQVVVVDEDIDPWSAEQVEWALSSRMRPERDMLLVPDAPAERSEPLDYSPGLVTKLGLDATAAEGDRLAGWTIARPPQDVLERVRRWLEAKGGAP